MPISIKIKISKIQLASGNRHTTPKIRLKRKWCDYLLSNLKEKY